MPIASRDILGWEYLESNIRQASPVLTVIDFFFSLHDRGFHRNTIDAVYAVRNLTALSQKYGCAIIVLCQEGESTGSTAIPAACAATATIRTEKGFRHIKTHKCRVQGGEIDILYELDKHSWPQKKPSNTPDFESCLDK